MKFENYMTLEFPSKSTNEGFARAAVACFAAQMDPNLEELGDIRTAVSEAVTNAIVHGYPNVCGKIVLQSEIIDDVIHINVFDAETLRAAQKEPEKYRPYTLAEWVDQHEIGEVIHCRNEHKQEFHVMYTGYVIDHGEDVEDIRTTGRIMLINMGYLLQELFERYEICINGSWQPFGVIEDD